ncbi:MAG: CoA-binding protein [Rhodocyclaceae bacterium]|nr:CoA-binding protein [Rhodocyclaceae bacterium]
MFKNPPPEVIREILRTVKTIAVVGFSPKPNRPSYNVSRALQDFGYRIIPVRPLIAEGLGEKAYARLTDLPEVPDLVDVFRAPDAVDEIVDACIAIGAKRLWLQETVVNEAAARRAQAAGIVVVMDRCIFKDYRALLA